jgi:DNA polymerase-1
MNIANPRDIKIIHGLPPVSKKGDKISMDTEFFGMEKRRLHRPHGIFAYLGCSYDGETVYYTEDEEQIAEFLQRLEAGVWIFANAKFDIRQLRRYANIPDRRNLWDVILIEQIQYSGYYNEFALNDLVRRYLDTYLPKEVRGEFSKTPIEDVLKAVESFDTYLPPAYSLTREQIEYASLDVAYTWRVFSEQRKNISEDDLRIWREIELPFMWTILSMSGIRLDTEKWSALAIENGRIAQEIQDKYGHWITVPAEGRKKEKQVFEGINLNSPAQVKNHFQDMGISPKSTDAETLQTIMEKLNHGKIYDFTLDLSNYRTYAKRASTYGLKFIEDHVEADGKIYADIYQIGAETGRTSCRTPNLQNQPHETAYRECFICDEDEVVIVADWSAQEPKFAAFLSGDEGLMDALNSDEKLYVRVARDILNISITKSDPEYKHMKSTVLGIFYGMSAVGLAETIGVTEEVAQEYINAFLETYPGVKEYMRKQKRAKDYVTSVNNRKIWLNKYSYQWERNALNAPIQGSAADAMKIAASKFSKFVYDSDCGWNLALLVHDEIVIITPKSDKDTAMKVLEDCMVSTANELHPGIRGSVEIFSGQSWACKS